MSPKLSPGSRGEGSETAQRRERAATAAQACETCRTRKSKCDEQRPRCGLCTRLDVECQYREPLPTKKDKTMVHILETLTRLENKFDNLSLNGSLAESRPGGSSLSQTPSSNPRQEAVDLDSSQELPRELQMTYKHLTTPHKIILWPSIYIHLINSRIQATSDLQYVLQEGTSWFLRQELIKFPNTLPWDVGLPYYAINTAAREQGYASKVSFPTLTIQQIHEQTEAYFNTFNVISPLLDREAFMNDVLAPLLREGYGDGDPKAILALLVFALGQVAMEGVFDRPISVNNGVASGFRGGSITRPPGLAIFNEARRRIGFISSQISFESVQIHLLCATYYSAHSRHIEFWRSSVAASMTCQVLIKCKSVDWDTPMGDNLKRCYWLCVLAEDFYHIDLDLPHTGIQSLEDEVPLPHFYEPYGQQTPSPFQETRSHFQYHFLAMIALRNLINRINSAIHDAAEEPRDAEEYGGPPFRVVQELARQLDSWRSLLPRPLQWSDNDKFDFPNTDPINRRPGEPLFSVDHGSVPIGHKYNLDVVTAQLRTRFYYARFIMFRPFIYKALHFPELMSEEDTNYCALAIKSACMWPIFMAPPKNKKRLVPHLFAWTQNSMSILLILKMTTENASLRTICENKVNRVDIQRTAALMLDWIRDVKQLDAVAEWSWRLLEHLFNTSDL